MGWTQWRQIAASRMWYSEGLDWDGPACYELAIAGPQGGDLRTVYVGETKNERNRIAAYASYGSHLSAIIDDHLRRGWSVWYRAQATDSKAAAITLQNNLLRRFDYDGTFSSTQTTKADHLELLHNTRLLLPGRKRLSRRRVS